MIGNVTRPGFSFSRKGSQANIDCPINQNQRLPHQSPRNKAPIIITGNDFSTLYAPFIRDGRMEKFYWAPTREDRIGVCSDFFGALRARVYDDEVRKWISEVGVENVGKRLVNSKEGPPTFEQPKMTLKKLLEYGNVLVQEQENVESAVG
ncbi:hypothetical protein CRYUN_Cryun09bG0017900 [Craigia yunnanensis]